MCGTVPSWNNFDWALVLGRPGGGVSGGGASGWSMFSGGGITF